MQALPLLLPAAVLAAGAVLLVLFYREVRQRRHTAERGRSLPDTARVPGQAMLAEIDRIDQELGDATSGSLAFLALFVGVVVAAGAFFGDPQTRLASAALSGAVGLAFFGTALTRIVRLMKVRKSVRRRYDGRIEVVRALNALESEGYRLFHDVAVQGFNVHHVVMGPSGVFAVETTAGAAPPRSGRVEDATVAYNGHALFFPRWTDDQTVRRAQKRAQRLSDWLRRTAGEAVAVRAVVAVPGWFVKRTTPDGIPVVHPSQIPSLFRHIKPQPLEGGLPSRIAQHIEQAAR
jgi:hypothetical protein